MITIRQVELQLSDGRAYVFTDMEVEQFEITRDIERSMPWEKPNSIYGNAKPVTHVTLHLRVFGDSHMRAGSAEPEQIAAPRPQLPNPTQTGN
jgi:hypothetical protein